MEKILRKPEVEKLTGYTGRHLGDLEKQGLFPKRFLISPHGRAVGWLESEIQTWISERAATRSLKTL